MYYPRKAHTKQELTTHFKDKITASSAKLLFSSDTLSSLEKSRTHFDKLRCAALFTLCPWSRTSLKLWECDHYTATYAEGDHRSLISLLPVQPSPFPLIPCFLSPWCSVPRYLGNALVMFCSPFSRHSLALEGRRTPLVLLSSTPKQPMWTAPSNPRLTFTLPETTAEKRSMTTQTQNQVFPKALGLPFSYRDIWISNCMRCKDGKALLWVGVEDISLIEEAGCHGNILNHCIG